MTSSDRIRIAVAAAAERLNQRDNSIPAISVPTSPGDLYVFDIKNDELAVEWVVVRDHPKDQNFVLAVPITDFPLIGGPDLVLPVDESMVARCGQADWFPRYIFDPTLRVGAISDVVLSLVRQRLADLARDRAILPSSADCDPEYTDHIQEVEEARQTLSKEVV